MKLLFSFFVCLAIFIDYGCNQGNIDTKKTIEKVDTSKYDYSCLSTQYELLQEPKQGEWLYDHKEKYESFSAYIKKSPRRANALRNKIYILPLGDFDERKLKVIDDVAEFFRNFFLLKVTVLKPKTLSAVPPESKRMFNAHVQYHTKYILYDILEPSMPLDAITYIALTDQDLFPDPDWNFVFGQASLSKGVGVWSYYYYGSPDVSEYEILEFKKRIIRTAAHETGHMFSIPHCIKYNCIMNGSNSLYESDHNPLYLCPDCLQKFCWNLNIDPIEHCQKMEAFWKKMKIFSISNFYKISKHKLERSK